MTDDQRLAAVEELRRLAAVVRMADQAEAIDLLKAASDINVEDEFMDIKDAANLLNTLSNSTEREER